MKKYLMIQTEDQIQKCILLGTVRITATAKKKKKLAMLQEKAGFDLDVGFTDTLGYSLLTG